MTTDATDVRKEIDWSTFPGSDGEPMAETNENQVQMIDLMFALRYLFRMQGRTNVTVAGNQLMYYNERSGLDHVSPDVYVALNVPPPGPSSWKMWLKGKFPDIVFEITSPSTVAEDLSDRPKGKRRLYAELGAREYYIYDPNGQISPRFRGYERQVGDTGFRPLPVLPSGGIMSPLMRAELRPMAMAADENRLAATYLRVIDPTNGMPIRPPEDERRDRIAAEQARIAAEQARIAAEQARIAAEQARLAEQEARLAAEERAAQAEAMLQDALARLARQEGHIPIDE